MKYLTKIERDNLIALTPYLKEDANKQIVLNIIRVIMANSRTMYEQDINWADNQLMH